MKTTLVLLILAAIGLCDEHEHMVSFQMSYVTKNRVTDWIFFIFVLQYTEGEEVIIWMNTVGPYHNRQETYSYYSLPFCQGPKVTISHYHETLGEALQGTELEFSGLNLEFKSEL